LFDLGLASVSIAQLQQAAEFACSANSDIHRLPFKVLPSQLMAAMVSTTDPVLGIRNESNGEGSEVEYPIQN
jgi:glycerol dehydrogenase